MRWRPQRLVVETGVHAQSLYQVGRAECCKSAGGTPEEAMIHLWGARDGFRREKHLRLALKEKQYWKRQDRERYSMKKGQDKPRH